MHSFAHPQTAKALTPEDQARQNIDHQLDDCGWIVQDMSAMNIMAGLGVTEPKHQEIANFIWGTCNLLRGSYPLLSRPVWCLRQTAFPRRRWHGQMAQVPNV